MRAKVVGPGFRACNLFKLGFIGLLLCLSVGLGWKKLRNDSVDDNIIDDHEDDLGTNAISVFVLMGKTGAGKSSFIKSLNGTDPLGRKPAVEAGIYSVTQMPAVYLTRVGKRKIMLLDTPGFDDSARDNVEVLNDIVSHLYSLALRPENFEMRGVVFLHDISEMRFGGSQKKTLGILKALVGEENLGNVIIGTTMWSRDAAKLEREVQRERALLNDQWSAMYKTTRLPYNNKHVAIQMIKDLLALPPVLLLAQEEILLPPHTVEATTVGKLVMPEGLLELENMQRESREQERAFEIKSKKQEMLLQEQIEHTRRKFEAHERQSREREESRKLKQQDEIKKLEGKLRREFENEKKNKERRDTEKRELEEKEIRRKYEQEDKAIRKLEDDLRVKLAEWNKVRKVKAMKDAEEERKIKIALRKSQKAVELKWYDGLMSATVEWFEYVGIDVDGVHVLIDRSKILVHEFFDRPGN